jgi:putative toxin-antitoxin system antitoxin component (TIGR02293 family)
MSISSEAIVDILGGARRLGVTQRAPQPAEIVLHEQALLGFDSAALKAFVERLPVSRATLAALLNTSEKTLERRLAAHGRLTTSESNALVRVARVVGLAKQLLKTDAGVNGWLAREQPGLGGRVPLDLLRTDAGAFEVETLLDRLYHGVLP